MMLQLYWSQSQVHEFQKNLQQLSDLCQQVRCHCHYIMKFLRTQAQLESFQMFIWDYFVINF